MGLSVADYLDIAWEAVLELYARFVWSIPTICLTAVLAAVLWFTLFPTPPKTAFDGHPLPSINTFIRWLRNNVVDLPHDQDCPICQCELEEPMQLPCKHIYCRTCLRSWFEDTSHNWCPTCHRLLFVAPTSSAMLVHKAYIVTITLTFIASSILMVLNYRAGRRWWFFPVSMAGPAAFSIYAFRRAVQNFGPENWGRGITLGAAGLNKILLFTAIHGFFQILGDVQKAARTEEGSGQKLDDQLDSAVEWVVSFWKS